MYEIFIDDIEEGGLKVEADQSDAWVLEIAKESFATNYADDSKLSVSCKMERIDKVINLSGNIRYQYYPVCDRCLEKIDRSNVLPIKLTLLPLYETKRQNKFEKESEDDFAKEDLGFGYYEGDSFDLAEIIREQVILSIPMKMLCDENCKGLCATCGADLNKNKCSCDKSKTDNRWAALAQLKPKGKA